MKTTNSAQKTETRKFVTGILALTLILTAASSNGQSRELPKSLSNQSQIAFLTSHHKSGKHEMFSVQVKNEKFAMESNEGSEFVSFRPETESSLRIEAWMLGNKYFTSNRPEFRTDAEKPLKIEGWMTDSHVWNK